MRHKVPTAAQTELYVYNMLRNRVSHHPHDSTVTSQSHTDRQKLLLSKTTTCLPLTQSLTNAFSCLPTRTAAQDISTHEDLQHKQNAVKLFKVHKNIQTHTSRHTVQYWVGN